jgi:hypothetical protein
MLSRTAQLDIPDLGEDTKQRARIAALGITISQFQKTLQGQALIERQELFILNGRLYQGYNQKAVECPEDHCVDSEIEAAHDIDGSKQRILDTRARRFEGNRNAKEREHAERNKLKISQERDELELILLRRKLAGSLEPEPETEPREPEQPEEPEQQTMTVGQARMKHACSTCGKRFPTSRALNMHGVGAKHAA